MIIFCENRGKVPDLILNGRFSVYMDHPDVLPVFVAELKVDLENRAPPGRGSHRG